MGCAICGRNSCAAWMHSAEEREQHEELCQLDDADLRRMVVDLRAEIEDLKHEISALEEVA